MKSYLCGLVHDIGKPGTRLESSVHYSFKGHGIVGGALIEMYVSPQLIENFTPYGLTKDDFGDISLCCDSHMCGYFANCGKEYDCKFHHACFRMMPPSATPWKMSLILILILILKINASFGDNLGLSR